MELLRDIFLNSVEANKTEPGQLAAVCRYWRSIIIGIPILWSTLKVGMWTEREQVAIWLQRGFPLKVVINVERARDRWRSFYIRPFAALPDILATTDKWHELTISEFPPEYTGSMFNFRVAKPMKLLKTLCVEAPHVRSSFLGRLLDLVPTSLLELRVHPSVDTAFFRQPHWLPLLQNLTVFIVDGSSTPGKFDLLPFLTQVKRLQIKFSSIPTYSLDTYLPLVHTLQQLVLDHSTFCWMLGRTFRALKECNFFWSTEVSKDLSMFKGLQVDMPVCQTLKWKYSSVTFPPFFSCPNLQVLEWRPHGHGFAFSVKSLHDFLLNCPSLQMLEISTNWYMGLASLVQFIFCDAWEQGVWQDIRSVELGVWGSGSQIKFFHQIGGDQQHYGRRWRKFTVSGQRDIFLRASM